MHLPLALSSKPFWKTKSWSLLQTSLFLLRGNGLRNNWQKSRGPASRRACWEGQRRNPKPPWLTPLSCQTPSSAILTPHTVSIHLITVSPCEMSILALGGINQLDWPWERDNPNDTEILFPFLPFHSLCSLRHHWTPIHCLEESFFLIPWGWLWGTEETAHSSTWVCSNTQVSIWFI